jgi:integrase/recombinase XerD
MLLADFILIQMHSYSKDGIIVTSMLDTRTPNAQGEYPVKIRVNYKRVRAYYPTGKNLTRVDWDNLPTSKSTASKTIKASIENSFNLVRLNVESLAERGDFMFDTLNTRLGKATGDTVNNALRAKISALDYEGRIGTMQIYEQTLRITEEFAGTNISFSSITVQWLRKCEQFWLQTKNQTTTGMHFRNIRTIINEARRAGIFKEAQYPFGKDRFEIKTGEAHKKSLTIKQIKSIFDYSDGNITTDKYKDLWLFIYLCNGINVADMIRLKYTNIVDGEISFVRQKTERTAKSRKEIRVIITPELQAIIDRWGIQNKFGFIFPYLNGKETPLERKTTNKELTKRINKRMKLIGEALSIGKITTYTARHTFATVLKRGGANIAYISESLGHSDLKTTEAYLASFERGDREKNANLLTQFI